MIRTLGGVTAGVAIAIALMMLVEGLTNMAFPPPRLNLNNPNAPAALPLANQLFPVLAWFLATLIGGFIAAVLSGRGWTAWLVAASVLAGEILDYMLGRHVAWVMIAGILAPLLAAWIVQKLWKRPPRVSA
jgi:hypothetical protein